MIKHEAILTNGEAITVFVNTECDRIDAVAEAQAAKMVRWLEAHNDDGNGQRLSLTRDDWQSLLDAVKEEIGG